MADRELSYKITTDASQATAGIKQFSTAAKRELKATSDAFDDTRSAGQKVADALTKTGDQVEAELKGSARAADALGRALGDTAGKLDVGTTVADLRKLGLSFDDIETDADALADAIKRIDKLKVDVDVDTESVGRVQGVTDGLDHATEAADRAQTGIGTLRGVTDELGGSASQFGTYGAAVVDAGETLQIFSKQLGLSEESAAKLSSVLGGIGVAGTAAFAAAGLVMNEYNKRQEEARKRVEAWTKALAVGGDVVQDMTAAQRDLNEQLETRSMGTALKDFLPFLSGVDKLNDNLLRAGLTVEQFNQLVAGGPDAIKAWTAAQEAAGNSLDIDLVKAAAEQYKALDEAQRKAATNAEVFALSQEQANAALDKYLQQQEPLKTASGAWKTLMADMRDGSIDTDSAVDALGRLAKRLGLTTDEVIALAQGELDREIDDVKTAMKDAEPAAADYAGAVDDIRGAFEGAQEALQSYYDAQRAAVDAGFAAQQAADDLAETITGYAAAVKDAEGDTAKLNDVYQDTRDKATAYADAQVKLAEDTAAAHGATLTAAQKQNVFLQSMKDSAAFMSGEQRQVIADYIAQVTGIPESQVTDILAATDPASVAVARGVLAALAVPKTVDIFPDLKTTAADQELNDWLGVKRSMKIGLTLNTAGVPASLKTGLGATSDQQSTPNAAPNAAPAAASSRSAGAANHADNRTFNVTVNTAATDGRATAAALDRWFRVNGARGR